MYIAILNKKHAIGVGKLSKNPCMDAKPRGKLLINQDGV